ncbi:MAG TPA: hypothetical protein DEB10_12640 [Ruminococcaceae bacterium]|nr:hypothetical protein [Oscillospiraceae bacterium]
MKKVLIALLLLVLVVSVCACEGKDKDGGKTPSNNSEVSESGDEELEKLRVLYDGKWINQDHYDKPFTIKILSTTSISMTYETSGELICDLFYSAGDLTIISVSMGGGISLGRYSIDTETGILTHKPTDTDAFTYTKEQ